MNNHHPRGRGDRNRRSNNRGRNASQGQGRGSSYNNQGQDNIRNNYNANDNRNRGNNNLQRDRLYSQGAQDTNANNQGQDNTRNNYNANYNRNRGSNNSQRGRWSSQGPQETNGNKQREGNRNRCNPNDPKYQEKPRGLTFFQTKDLLLKMLEDDYPENIPLKLLSTDIRFGNFLNNTSEQNSETDVLILRIILKAKKNLLMESNNRSLLAMVINSEFCKKRLDDVINTEFYREINWEILELLLQFFVFNLYLIPGLAYDGLLRRINNLILLMDSMHLNIPDGKAHVMELLNELKVLKESLDKLHTKSSGICGPRNRVQKPIGIFDDDDPPEDYRQLATFPTSFDILEQQSKNVFIRCNKIQGTYKSVDDYLDIQFRLMREDFIQPLREGLISFKNKSSKRQTDVRVYKNVGFINTLPTERQGIIHNMSFELKSKRKINWFQTKRFLYGSLLCFSNDNFRSLLFATVIDRDAGRLEKGVLTVKFQDDNKPMKDIEYVMIESTNMFESYRHVLVKLQATNKDNLCLQNYLVFANDIIKKPKYLLNNIGLEYEVDGKLKLHPGLDETVWPRAVELGLDESQLRAFKLALTNEIAIIQGPPGTGKTYLGLKICKCLLENVTKKLGNFGPILIVCYTNHALDQFLEGIAEFTQNIVRIGNRCKSEILQNYSLINCRRTGEANSEIRKRKYKIHNELRDLGEQIIEYQIFVKNSHNRLIRLQQLEAFMKGNQYDYLFCVGLKDWLFGNTTNFMEDEYDMESEVISNLVEWLMYEEMVDPIRKVAIDTHLDMITGHDDYEYDEREDADNEVNYLTNQRNLDVDNSENIRNIFDEFERKANVENKGFVDDSFSNGPVVDSEGFQTVITKTSKNLFKNRLKRNEMISDEEAEAYETVQLATLHTDDRWRLYRYWRHKFVQSLIDKSQELELLYEQKNNELLEIGFEEDRQIMVKKDVIGMTTTGAARYGRVLDIIQCKLIIVEEAAEVLESHIIASLNEGCQHLILIGDHKQLKPNPAVFNLAKRYGLDLSLFERLINNSLSYETLQLQHRMRPEIAEIVTHIYPDLQNHESVYNYPPVAGVATNLFFFDHQQEEAINTEILSYSNKFEAELIVRFCRHLMKNGIENKKITILTLYTGQMFVIRQLMDRKLFEGVRVCVVDNYQGEENDIIFLSLVRSNQIDKIGFLAIENRICVSLSRAKHGFYVFGNFQLLTSQSELWKTICLKLRDQGYLGSELKFRCQLHPEKKLETVKIPSDFDNLPEGGCQTLCNKRLNCGHACRKSCHFLDQSHEEYKCTERCTKSCENDHRCVQKCYDTCRKCQVSVKKVIPDCGHEQLMSCFQKPTSDCCFNVCDKILDCGHNCLKQCRQKCDFCTTKVDKKCNECQHIDKYPCSVDINDINCKRPCKELLDCEHQCSGTCGRCFNGRLHEICTNKCRNRLVCGHVCQMGCSADCPPCKVRCEDGCVHNVCPRTCGEQCVPCYEKCKWRCVHKRCGKLCSEICDRERCDENCSKVLNCKLCKAQFICYGVCGEPCRKICKICDPTINEIFFGTEDEENSRFITLWTCSHSFEVESMDKFMSTVPENHEIVMKRCPKCNSVINKRSCFRYANIIKTITQDVKKVQNKINDKYLPIATNKFWRNYYLHKWKLKEMFEFLDIEKENYFEKLNKTDEQMSSFIIQKWNVALKLALQIHDELYTKLLMTISIVDLDIYDLKLNRYIERCLIKLLLWLRPHKRKFNDFENNQYFNEIERVKMIIKLKEVSNIHNLAELPMFMYELKAFKSFTQTVAKDFIDRLGKYVMHQGHSFKYDTTEEERITVVNAVGLSRGHWYKCPNGHIYAIGECGGATEVSVCPECKAKVGGTNHQLVENNIRAEDVEDILI